MKENENKEFKEKAKAFSEMIGGIFSSWKQEKSDSRAYMYFAVEFDKDDKIKKPLFIMNSASGDKITLLSSMELILEKNPKFLESLALPVFIFFSKYMEENEIQVCDITVPTKAAFARFLAKLDFKKVVQLVEGLNIVADDK